MDLRLGESVLQPRSGQAPGVDQLEERAAFLNGRNFAGHSLLRMTVGDHLGGIEDGERDLDPSLGLFFGEPEELIN